MTPAVFTRCAVERGRDDRFYAVAIYGRRGELLDAHVFRTGRSPLLDELFGAPLAAWATIAARLVADGHHLPGETLAAMFASHALLVALAQERRPGASIEEALEVVVACFAEGTKRAAVLG